jgi:hypothetical protein
VSLTEITWYNVLKTVVYNQSSKVGYKLLKKDCLGVQQSIREPGVSLLWFGHATGDITDVPKYGVIVKYQYLVTLSPR